MTNRAAILGAKRMPFGRFDGVLSPLSALELGGATIGRKTPVHNAFV